MDLERGCMQKSVFEMLFLPVLPFLNSFRILLFQPFFQLFPALFQPFDIRFSMAVITGYWNQLLWWV